jgi:RNA polymerase sigma-70 factor (ECF subfamily)
MDDYKSFYKAWFDKLFSYVMRMTGDYDLSGDIVQESFTRYLQHYGRDDRNQALLYTIARNLFYDHWRKRKHREAVDPVEDKYSRNPEDVILVREEYRRVLAAFGKLEDHERDILSLVLSGDLSYRDVAAIVGTSEANIKVKIHRARLKLKKILQEDQ